MKFVLQFVRHYFNENSNQGRIQQIICIIAAVFFVVHPLIYIPGLRNVSSMPRYAALGVVASILLILSSIAIRRSDTRLRWNHLFGLIVIFFGWSLLSLIWTVDGMTGLIDNIELLNMVLLAIILGQLVSWRNMEGIMAASVIGAVGVALIGIGQYNGFNPLNVIQLVAPSSLFTNKNFAALYLDLVIPFALIFILLARSNRVAWLYAFAFSVILALEILIRSRGTWLALLVGVSVMILLVSLNSSARVSCWQRLKSRYQQVLFVIVIVAGVTLAPSQVFTTAVTVKQVFNFEQNSSASVRLVAYKNSLQMIRDNPVLGVGQGGFRIGFRPYMFAKEALPGVTEDIYLVRLHSDPLQYFVELGAVGGILFLALISTALFSLYRLIRIAETGSTEYFLSIGILLALVIGMTHALVDFPLRKPSSAIQFWSLLGMTAGLTYHRNVVTQTRIKPFFGLLFLSIGALLFVFNVYFYSSWLYANTDLQQALKQIDAKACPQAAALIDSSVQRFPFDYQARQYRVQIYGECLTLPPQQILDSLNEELAYDPYNTRALLTRGWILASHNYLDAAETDYLRVTTLLPNRASGYIGHGQVAFARGNRQQAIQFYKQALQVEPNNRIALRVMKELDSH